MGKTKVMCNSAVNKMDISISGGKIEEVDSYIYLGQMVTKDHNQEQELRHRIGLGWTMFGKLDSIMWNKSIPLRLKMKVHNECTLLVITYRSETWSLSKTHLQKMVTTQWKVEWIMMGLILQNRKSTSWIRLKTGVTDIIHQICGNKHWWAGHVSWLKDNRWTKCMTEWCPWDHKWSRGSPKGCWWDDLNEAIGPNWSHVAKDWCCWMESREGSSNRSEAKPWWWSVTRLMEM